MVSSRVKACRLIRSPLVADTGGAGVVAPIVNRLFVVAQDVNNRRVLHEDGLEGRRMTRNVMSKSLSVPRSKKPTKFFFQIRGQNLKGLEGRRFSEPACLSTIGSLCQLPEEPRTERVLECFGPGVVGHNTLLVPLHWSEGTEWSQIWTVCWNQGNE